jgi:Zn-dependent protease
MSSTELIEQRCRNCTTELPAGALACPHCNSLVHADQLDQLAAQAKSLEAQSQWRPARDAWLQALALLPQDSQQSAWIRKHAKDLLGRALDAEGPQTKSKWAKRLGPLGPVAVLLAKAKGFLLLIFKLKFLFSLAAFVALYWALWGPKFGIGFAALIVVHEMGHFIDIKRRGLPAEMPVFLPGLGAYVKWQAMGVPLKTRAAVSLAGPLAGWLASAVCLLIWWKTGDSLWAALARSSAWLNILNLIPVWILDGGSAITALGRLERALLLLGSLALGITLGEAVFYFVAAGAAYRLFTKDVPETPSRMIAAYYLALVVCLGLVLHAVPGAMFPAAPVR